MKRTVVTLAAASVLASGPAGSAQTQPPDARTQSIYVGVVDGKGNAVTAGLSAKDFAVKEDGVAREVVRAEPATEQLDIILLIDDSQASTGAIPHIRDGPRPFSRPRPGQGQDRHRDRRRTPDLRR